MALNRLRLIPDSLASVNQSCPLRVRPVDSLVWCHIPLLTRLPNKTASLSSSLVRVESTTQLSRFSSTRREHRNHPLSLVVFLILEQSLRSQPPSSKLSPWTPGCLKPTGQSVVPRVLIKRIKLRELIPEIFWSTHNWRISTSQTMISRSSTASTQKSNATLTSTSANIWTRARMLTSSSSSLIWTLSETSSARIST